MRSLLGASALGVLIGWLIWGRKKLHTAELAQQRPIPGP